MSFVELLVVEFVFEELFESGGLCSGRSQLRRVRRFAEGLGSSLGDSVYSAKQLAKLSVNYSAGSSCDSKLVSIRVRPLIIAPLNLLLVALLNRQLNRLHGLCMSFRILHAISSALS